MHRVAVDCLHCVQAARWRNTLEDFGFTAPCVDGAVTKVCRGGQDMGPLRWSVESSTKLACAMVRTSRSGGSSLPPDGTQSSESCTHSIVCSPHSTVAVFVAWLRRARGSRQPWRAEAGRGHGGLKRAATFRLRTNSSAFLARKLSLHFVEQKR